MKRRPFTGIHSNYVPAPAWDGTPVPESDSLAVLARFWRAHGDPDGSLEVKIYGIIRARAQFQICKRTKTGSWRWEIIHDCAAAAMMALGADSWRPDKGCVRFVDTAIIRFYFTLVKRRIRRMVAIPTKSLEGVDVPQRQPEQFVIPDNCLQELLDCLSNFERTVLMSYSGGRRGGMKDLARELNVDVRMVDNAIERIKHKARDLGLMQQRKKHAK